MSMVYICTTVSTLIYCTTVSHYALVTSLFFFGMITCRMITCRSFSNMLPHVWIYRTMRASPHPSFLSFKSQSNSIGTIIAVLIHILQIPILSLGHPFGGQTKSNRIPTKSNEEHHHRHEVGRRLSRSKRTQGFRLWH